MRFRQFQLARIFGIPLIIDYSWLPMAILHVWLLTQIWLPARIHPPWPVYQNLLVGVLITVLYFASVLVHELAHALIARLEGIRIHDIQLTIIGGWARLVEEPQTAMAEFRVVVAGPAGSFLLGMLFTGLLLLIQLTGSRSWLAVGAVETCYYLAFANVFLAIFNLLPGLPMDGGRALRAILWHRRKDILSATRTAKRMGVAISYILIFYSIFLVAYGTIRNTLAQDILPAMWLLIIGVYLKTSAERHYRNVERKNEDWNVAGTVGAVMSTPVVSVRPELKISEFIDQILSRHRHTIFPVARNGRLHGLLSLERLRETTPREKWEQIHISEVMEPISDDLFIPVRASIEHAEHKLDVNNFGYLAVIDPDGFLIGYMKKRMKDEG
jgi:Zn-dependent protease